MVRTVSQRVEIAFWGVIIPLMCESRLVQAFLPTALMLIDRRESLIRLAKFLALAWAGLLLGLMLGFLRVRLGM